MEKILILCLAFSGLNIWADLAVTPPLLQYKNTDKFKEITIKNTSNKDRLFNISIKEWTQKNGEDFYTDTDDLIVLPITTQIKSNSEKLIRVILKSPVLEATQNSYRLFIREAPFGKKKEASGTSFEFLFSIIVPVFTHGKNFTAHENLVYTAQLDATKSKVLCTITNMGNTVELLSKVDAKAVSNTSYNQARYILHGAAYTWEFPVKSKQIKDFPLNYLLNEKPVSRAIEVTPYAAPTKNIVKKDT